MSIYLIMELGNIPLYREPIEYDGLATAGEKMNLQQRMAADMQRRYAREILRSGRRPVFYVSGIMSKGNKFPTDYITENAPDEVPAENYPKLRMV